MAERTRRGTSSPRSDALPHRAYASAIAFSDKPNTGTPQPSTALTSDEDGTPLQRETISTTDFCTSCCDCSYPELDQPAVRARASIAACLPEQLLCRRVGRMPLSRIDLRPRADSGSCGPQARSPSSKPMSDSIDATRATCSGSPPCDPHAIAICVSSHPSESVASDSSSGIT